MPENIRMRNAVRSGPCKWLTLLIAISLIVSGCANTSNMAGNVATGAGIDAMAGVPYAGVIGLAATAVEIISKIGKPKVGEPSAKLKEIIMNSPWPILDESKTKVVGWKTDSRFDPVQKKVVNMTVENSPPTNLGYKAAYMIAMNRYVKGDFGDGGEDAVKKNLDAWRDGKLVEAEYAGPNGAKVVIVSDKNEPGEVMTYEEWMTRKNAANNPKIP